jgi:sugar phosphate isomerase/epimerase
MKKRKYSVFIFNVASCSDRYCAAYGRKYTIDEMFDRVASIPLLTAVDIVLTQDFIHNKERIIENLKRTGLKVASVAVDTFANPIYQKGSFASTNKKIREQAIKDGKTAMDFAAEVGCNIMTTWPGQDGYDYIFQADYMKERQLFSDAVHELCEYRKDITVTMEYKIKEPRTHSYISTIGTTLLMCQDIGLENLGIALDFGHSLLGYESPAEAVAMCKMYGDRLKHIHINDNYRLWDDDMIVGSIHTLEFIEFIYWLRRTGYTGYITLDQFPFREDGRDAVNESALWLDYLETLVDKADPDEIERVIGRQDAVSASALMRKLLKGTEN